MNILLTGSSGFIGKSLLNILDNKFNILSITRKKTSNSKKILIGDLNKLEIIKNEIINFNPEIVIHLAWEGIPDYSKDISEKNYYNSKNFLKFVIQNTNCKKIISVGSCWEYQNQSGSCKEVNININNEKPNKYFINAKKKLFEDVKSLCIEKNIILNWFILFFVYGKGQKKSSIIPHIVRSIKNGDNPTILFPYNKNDYIYVDDVSRIIFKFLIQDFPSGRYNLGTGKTSSVIDLCKIIEKKLLKSNIISDNICNVRDNKVKSNFWANMEKTFKVIGSYKFKSIEEGINLYIKSVEEKK